MTDDLRTRIAAITRAHRCFYRGPHAGFGCRCGWIGQSADHDPHVADVLIRELGWREEVMQELTVKYGMTGTRSETPMTSAHRYVTSWEADE